MTVIFCTISQKESKNFAMKIVKEKLAACVNIVSNLESVYEWEDCVVCEPESLLIIKTSQEKESFLRDWIEQNHPYSVPEILSIFPDKINPKYKKWLMNYVQED